MVEQNLGRGENPDNYGLKQSIDGLGSIEELPISAWAQSGLNAAVAYVNSEVSATELPENLEDLPLPLAKVRQVFAVSLEFGAMTDPAAGDKVPFMQGGFDSVLHAVKACPGLAHTIADMPPNAIKRHLHNAQEFLLETEPDKPRRQVVQEALHDKSPTLLAIARAIDNRENANRFSPNEISTTREQVSAFNFGIYYAIATLTECKMVNGAPEGVADEKPAQVQLPDSLISLEEYRPASDMLHKIFSQRVRHNISMLDGATEAFRYAINNDDEILWIESRVQARLETDFAALSEVRSDIVNNQLEMTESGFEDAPGIHQYDLPGRKRRRAD